MARLNLDEVLDEQRFLINKGLALFEKLADWEANWKEEANDLVVEKTLEAADFVLNRLHQLAEVVDNSELAEPALRNEVED